MTESPGVSTGAAPKRKRRVRWGRVILALVVLLVVTEILLRVVFGFGNPLLTIRDEACGYRFKPDQHVYRIFSHNDINHFGMRSPEIEAIRPKGTRRFFFLGDSITYGTTYVDQAEIFTSRLAKLLPDVEHGPVEVLNESAGGWGPQNEAGYLLANGTFDSNAVIFVFNTGDLGEEFAEFPEGNLNYPTERPWTAIGEVVERYVIPRIMGKIFKDAGTTMPDPARMAAAQAKNFKKLEEAKALAEKSHAVMGVAFIPCSIYTKEVNAEVGSAFRKWAESERLFFMDITPALEAEDPKQVTVDGIHLRSRGDEVVAAEFVRQWGKVDAAMKAGE